MTECKFCGLPMARDDDFCTEYCERAFHSDKVVFHTEEDGSVTFHIDE